MKNVTHESHIIIVTNAHLLHFEFVVGYGAFDQHSVTSNMQKNYQKIVI